MAGIPSEEAISTFESITGLPQVTAIEDADPVSAIQKHNNDLNAAANAFLENPNSLQTESFQRTWNEDQFHSDNGQNAFSVHPPDSLNPNVFSDSAPSRPPSRVSNTANGSSLDYNANSTKNLTAAEREEQEMQQAVAMSMSQNLSGQENGVMESSNPHFGPASRSYYETDNWALTSARNDFQEILLNPEPADRKRLSDQPVFIKPLPNGLFLPSLITILHAIPMAREALLARGYELPDYGHDSEWWDGSGIKNGRVIDLEQDNDGFELEEMVFETQRLMAFLDRSDRAYGSAEVLTRCDRLRNSTDDVEGTFLDAWRETILRVLSENELTDTFTSTGVQVISGANEETAIKPFPLLDLQVDSFESKQTLYEAIDATLWPSAEEDISDETFLSKVGEVFSIRITNRNHSATSLGVKVPSVWYPQRYLEESKDEAKKMRQGQADLQKELQALDQVQDRYTQYMPAKGTTVDASNLLQTAMTYLKQSSPTNDQVNDLVNEENDLMNSQEPLSSSYAEIAKELQVLSDRVLQKVEKLEDSKKVAQSKLKELSQLYTTPDENFEESPRCKYSLRGVSTDYHVTYVLEKTKIDDENDILSGDAVDWQWWRIEFSGSGSNPISYSKVREVEVLKAARDDSRAALLVYATDKALSYPTQALPSQLENFVRADNLSFAAELDQAALSWKQPSPSKRKADDNDDDDGGHSPNWGGHKSEPAVFDLSSILHDPGASFPPSYQETTTSSSYSSSKKPLPPLPEHASLSSSRSGYGKGRKVRQSYDESIPTSLQGIGAGLMKSDPMVLDGNDDHESDGSVVVEPGEMEEMKEGGGDSGGGHGLGIQGKRGSVGGLDWEEGVEVEHREYAADEEMGEAVESGDEGRCGRRGRGL